MRLPVRLRLPPFVLNRGFRGINHKALAQARSTHKSINAIVIDQLRKLVPLHLAVLIKHFPDEPAVAVNLFQILVEPLIVLEIAVLMEKSPSKGKLFPSGGKVPVQRHLQQQFLCLKLCLEVFFRVIFLHETLHFLH